MNSALKKTTNLTGLAVAKDPFKKLTILYDKTLKVLEKMPQEAAYRRHTSAFTQERLNIVKTESDVGKAEAKINQGQIEEVILQAERELNLARKMLQWQPWQPLVGEAPASQWKWPI